MNLQNMDIESEGLDILNRSNIFENGDTTNNIMEKKWTENDSRAVN